MARGLDAIGATRDGSLRRRGCIRAERLLEADGVGRELPGRAAEMTCEHTALTKPECSCRSCFVEQVERHAPQFVPVQATIPNLVA